MCKSTRIKIVILQMYNTFGTISIYDYYCYVDVKKHCKACMRNSQYSQAGVLKIMAYNNISIVDKA